MAQAWQAVLALLLVAAAGTDGTAASRRDLATTKPGPAIVGGSDVPITQRNRYPYMTSLRENTSGFHYCGATLIGGRFVLTAAHCVTDSSSTGNSIEWAYSDRLFPKVRIGPYESYPIPATPGPGAFELRQVVGVAVHAGYDSNTLQNDIALLLLDRPSLRAPVNLTAGPAFTQQRAPVGARMLAIGWGQTNFEDELGGSRIVAFPLVLQQLWVTRVEGGGGSPTHLYAGNPPNYLSDTWKGDSGGPLLIPSPSGNPAADVQYAIVSGGNQGSPGWYTSIAPFVDWIARGKQLLLSGGAAATHSIQRLPRCVDRPANSYCVYCQSYSTQRVACTLGEPCWTWFQGQVMLLKKCGDYDVMGQVQPSGCYSSLQWKDFSGHAQGTGLMGVQTVALRAALGTRVPSDADTCQPPAPWVLRRCPGAAGGACAPGSGRLTGRLDGCCACRRTRFVVPYTSVYEPTSAIGYYGNTPNCLLPGPYRALPAGTMVHYTGAMVTGNPRLGCQARRYAQIVMESLPSEAGALTYRAFWVLAENLIPCDALRSCGLSSELGGNCQGGVGCCTVAAQGGAPGAQCRYPPDVEAPSACTVA